MARITTTDGKVSVDTILTDRDAANACGRIPLNHKDREFATSLVSSLNTYGSRISHNRRVWLHVLANQQVRRETPAPVVAAPVQMTAALPAPKPVTPVAEPVASMTAEEVNMAACGLSLSMFVYYIPDTAEVNNPSGFLRRRAVRVDGSVWIMPTNSVPDFLTNQLREAGARVLAVPFDVAASRDLLEAAINFANDEVKSAVKRNQAAAATALEALNSPDGDPTAKRRTYDKKISEIQKRLTQLAEDMKVGADVFGISRGINFQALRNVANGITESTATRATVYANSVNILREIGTDTAVALAAAVEADAVPAVIVADAIQDADRVEEAEALRDAFKDAVPEVENYESGIYSLADVGEDD